MRRGISEQSRCQGECRPFLGEKDGAEKEMGEKSPASIILCPQCSIQMIT